MKTIKIKVSTIDKVKEFVNKAEKANGLVLVTTLDEIYRINGKSIMGMFSLDLTKPLNVSFEEKNNEIFDTYIKSVAIE